MHFGFETVVVPEFYICFLFHGYYKEGLERQFFGQCALFEGHSDCDRNHLGCCSILNLLMKRL